MSTILIAVLIMLCTIGLVLLFIHINRNNQTRKSKALLNAFSETGSEKGLAFSSQEILKQRVIGLDGIKHTLLVFDFNSNNSFTIIDLEEVKSCTLQKEIDTVNVGTKKKPETRQHLRSIGLKFHLRNGLIIFVAFYEDHINNIYEIEELTAKVKDWEVILSKMLLKEIQSRA